MRISSRRLLLATGAAVVSLMAPLCATVPAQASPDLAQPTLTGPQAAAVAQMAKDWQLSWREAERRIARQNSEEKLAADVADQYPDRFAGAYVDHAHGGQLILLSTAPIDATSLARAAGIDPATVTLTAAHFSLDRLNRDNGTLVRRAQQDRGRLGNVHTFVDVPANRVRVVLPSHSPDPNARAAFVGQVASNPDTLISGGTTEFTSEAATCDFWTCPPPLRGGVEDDFFDASGGGYLCTLGFIGVDLYNNDPVAISAGHCQTYNGPYASPGPDDLFDSGPTIGNMTRYQNGGNDDGEVIDLNTGGGMYSPDSSNYVYQRNQPQYIDLNGQIQDEQFQITSVASNSQVVTGVYVCKSARTSGFTCGDINEVSVSGTACEANGTNCTNYTDFFGFTGCSAGGDSGGPIYDPSAQRAFGLVSYGPSSQHDGCTDTSGETYGPMIGNVTYGLHVSINTIDGGSLV